MDQETTVTQSVTITDGTGALTVDTAQLPAALGPTTYAGSVSVVPGYTGTNNTTYVVNGDMSADVNGPSITVASGGRLEAYISWATTGSPVGFFRLQALAPDGVTWAEINGSSAEFLVQPNVAAGTNLCSWRELQVFSTVRIIYDATSGGTANTSLQIQTRTV